MKVSRISRVAMIGVLVLALVTLASPAFAQGGTLRGKVIDDQNKPVNGAKITMVETGTNRKFETKTDLLSVCFAPDGKILAFVTSDSQLTSFGSSLTANNKSLVRTTPEMSSGLPLGVTGKRL